MLTVNEALEQILVSVETVAPQSRGLPDCLNHVLAETLTTPHDSPPFDKSMMDGFAVMADGFGEGEVTLDVGETITAGTVPQQAVTQGTAARIMTGAPIPAGANCVIPIEKTQFDESAPETVTIVSEHVSSDQNVLRQGGAAQQGTPLMASGVRLQPQHIAVLAEFGVADVPVHRQPQVAVLATGDELLSYEEPLTPGRIRNSNEPMLVNQIRRACGVPQPLGVARDNRKSLREAIRVGLTHDFLLLSGGVSAGTLDLVPSELQAAGVEQVFHKIKMKPGKPLWFGKLQTEGRICYVFGLPGNPVSSMICFEAFVRSALKKFAGEFNPAPCRETASLTQEVSVRGDRETWFPANIFTADGKLQCETVRWGGSADLRSTANANGMAILQPGPAPRSVGELVEVVRW